MVTKQQPVAKKYLMARERLFEHIPNLIDIQLKSFEWFLQAGKEPSKREKQGLEEVFREVFPIQDYVGNLCLEYNDYSLGLPMCKNCPQLKLRKKCLFDDCSFAEKDCEIAFIGETPFRVKNSPDQCRKRDLTYSIPLSIRVQLIMQQTGEVKEQEIFLVNLPCMTDRGTFIINGAERVIVSQLHRSPGVYYSFNRSKKVYSAKIVPYRGAWMEFELDLMKDAIFVRLDRKRKIPITTFLRTLGYGDDERIMALFDNNETIASSLKYDKQSVSALEGEDKINKSVTDSLKAIFSKLRQGDLFVEENARGLIKSLFFDSKKYDLGDVGRYKVDKKLRLVDRLSEQIAFKDIVNPTNKKVLVKGDEKISKAVASEIEALQIPSYIRIGEDLRGYRIMFNPKCAEIRLSDVGLGIVDLLGRIAFESVVDTASGEIIVEQGQEISEDVYNRILELNLESVKIQKDRVLSVEDIVGVIRYLVDLSNGIGRLDDIDHLSNRRIRRCGELLQNQFRISLTRMERVIKERMTIHDLDSYTPQLLINTRPVSAVVDEFFGSSQLSQFMDQNNPLAELTHKRRLSALGPGGIKRDRAGFEVRDVHPTHDGRICPIETPEGQNIGLINSLASYARVDKYGFIETPYLKVVQTEDGKSVVQDEFIYLTADKEELYHIAQANINVNDQKEIIDNIVIARYMGETIEADRHKIQLMDVSPKQIVAVSTACIPFLEHDDANRALMGANMQRQAIPLLKPEAPYVATGIEAKAAKDSGVAVVCEADGIIQYVDSGKIIVLENSGKLKTYPLIKFERSNHSTCVNQKPIVKAKETVRQGDILADGASMDQGEMALGRNIVIAFMTWNGYNYEDAVIMSERLVQDDVYTSIHIEKYEVEVRDTKLGKEEITNELDNEKKDAIANLDIDGIVRLGAEVKEGDVLVGKVTPKGQTDPTPEERLSHALFSDNSKDVRNTSLRVPHGGGGIVHRIEYFNRKNGDDLGPGVNEKVRVFIVQKRKITEGDKMSGRHGNKGVISKILPQEDMPYMEDGTPIDIMLNPQGIPSRLNIGQVLEVHLGMAAKKLGVNIATPVFDGVKSDDLTAIMKEANMDEDGKTILRDGRTGDTFDNRINVGVMYMIKLAHMVDDKLHARSEGPYTLVTQQPMGGKAQNGGQRFGEMEVWALEAYGASYTLREMLTIKSDDIVGRNKVYKAIVDGTPIPTPGIPESFRVLVKELQGLGISVKLIDSATKEDVANKSLVEEIAQFSNNYKRG